MSCAEDLNREQLEVLQRERLQALVGGPIASNAFWQAHLQSAGVGDLAQWAAGLGSGTGLGDLPVCSKQDLVTDQAAHPPYGSNFSQPLSSYTRLHQTSGTTGHPLRWLDTPEAWSNVLDAWSQIFRIAGVESSDVFAFPFSFGPFIGFWAAFEGAVAAGHLSVPGGGLSSAARLRMIEDNRATVVCCTPTYALRLAEVASEEGVELSSGSVRMLIVAGEPGGSVSGVRDAIESAWGARVIDHWGMTELGPMAVECAESPGGMHILETECVAEVVDPESLEPVAVGEQGELLITTLRRIGSPVLRYRTGDLVVVDPDPCACGRALLRLRGGILGRGDDMITVRGNNVFPSSIEAVIRSVDGVAEFRVIVGTRNAMDSLTVEIEPSEGVEPGLVVESVATAIRETFSFAADVRAVAVGSLPRFELKGRRFVRD